MRIIVTVGSMGRRRVRVCQKALPGARGHVFRDQAPEAKRSESEGVKGLPHGCHDAEPNHSLILYHWQCVCPLIVIMFFVCRFDDTVSLKP